MKKFICLIFGHIRWDVWRSHDKVLTIAECQRCGERIPYES